MQRFPSIEQFRNVIRNVQSKASYVGRNDEGLAIYDSTRPIPTLPYRGTVKLHGTNASVVLNTQTDTLSFQSRSRVLDLQSDNAGFMLYMLQHEAYLRHMFWTIMTRKEIKSEDVKQIVIFGEWAGQGIQKGVAISEVPRFFAYFGIKVIVDDEDSYWLDIAEFDDLESEDARIVNVLSFGSWELDVDFNHPQLSQQKFVEITEAVEAECPAGLKFGVSGVGEGVVWSCRDPEWRSSDFNFKVKGEKHSVSKVKTLAAVDVEQYAKQVDFVQDVTSANRLEQMFNYMLTELQKPAEMSSMGAFLSLVFADINKEEQDTIVANQFDTRKLNGLIANVARPWFTNRINSEAGL